MVSTRQSSNVGSAGETVICEPSGGVKTRHSLHSSTKVNTVTSLIPSTEYPLPIPVGDPRQSSGLHILNLPQEIFDKIFSYVGYKNVSQMRLVCRQFNLICSSILNSTFQRLQTQMLQRFHGIKAKMPRRESARRNHPLACESDIVETLHMRLTLLQMSFGKHIERKHCCFFAGEILDEVYRILHYIKVTPKLARPYRVTDELFDLSTMAMEYFKEHIEPTLPEISYFGTDFLDFSTNGLATSSTKKSWMLDSPPHNSSKAEYESPSAGEGDRPQDVTPQPQSNTMLRKRIRKIKLGMKKYSSQLAVYKRELRSCKAKIAEQQKQFLEMASRMDDNDKKNDETARKFSTLLQELNKCKTELQYWRSKSPLTPPCPACGTNLSGGLMDDLMVAGSIGGWIEGLDGGAAGPSTLPPEVAGPLESPATASSATMSTSGSSATPESAGLTTPAAATSTPTSDEPPRSFHHPTKRKSFPFISSSQKKSKRSRLEPLKSNARTRRS